MNLALEHRNNSLGASTLARRLNSILSPHQHNIGANRNCASILHRFRDIASYTLCPKKVSPLNILQQPPQTCTDLNEILHTQDDVYFCHDVKFHKNPLFRLRDVQFFQLPSVGPGADPGVQAVSPQVT